MPDLLLELFSEEILSCPHCPQQLSCEDMQTKNKHAVIKGAYNA